MEPLKTHQPALTIAEQIENLKAIGLIIKDEEYAKRILNDISYFRLIKAYSLNLKLKNGNYHENITFEHIVELYLFNANLRQILFPEIEKIEVNARCRIANYISTKYGILGYKDAHNFANSSYHQVFLDDIGEELRRNSKAPFVKNFQENYEGGELPFYALVEISSFGTLSKFYKNLNNADKKAIAGDFGVGYTFLESWLESLSYVRNICAHYARLYNFKSKTKTEAEIISLEEKIKKSKKISVSPLQNADYIAKLKRLCDILSDDTVTMDTKKNSIRKVVEKVVYNKADNTLSFYLYGS